MFRLFNCACCIQKDNQIAYLQKIVDNLLLNKGIKPVAIQEGEPEETEEEIKERADKQAGVIKYGE